MSDTGDMLFLMQFIQQELMKAQRGDIKRIIGPEGPKGNTGPKGDKGDQGAKGPKGERGDRGPAGAEGKAGPPGADGRDGRDGVDGISITHVSQGLDGDIVIHMSDGTEHSFEVGGLGEEQVKTIIATGSVGGKGVDVQYLNDLLDVTIGVIQGAPNPLLDNDVLTYDAGMAQWINKPFGAIVYRGSIDMTVDPCPTAPAARETGDMWVHSGPNGVPVVDWDNLMPNPVETGDIAIWNDAAAAWDYAGNIGTLGVTDIIEQNGVENSTGDINNPTVQLSYPKDGVGYWPSNVDGDPANHVWETAALLNLDDVDIVTVPPTAGDGIVWDDAQGKWVTGNPAPADHLLMDDAHPDVQSNYDGLGAPEGDYEHVLTFRQTTGAGDGIWTNRSINEMDHFVDSGHLNVYTTNAADGMVLVARSNPIYPSGFEWVAQVAPLTDHVLDDHLDVDVSTNAPIDGQVLTYDAASAMWINEDASLVPHTLEEHTNVVNVAGTDGQVLTLGPNGIWRPEDVQYIHGLTDHTDVDLLTTAPVDGDVLTYDNFTGMWIPGDGGVGAHDLDFHDDVTIANAEQFEVLTYDANLAQWINRLQALGEHSDVDTTGAQDTQVLAYDSNVGQWLPADAIGSALKFIASVDMTEATGVDAPAAPNDGDMYINTTNGDDIHDGWVNGDPTPTECFEGDIYAYSQTTALWYYLGNIAVVGVIDVVAQNGVAQVSADEQHPVLELSHAKDNIPYVSSNDGGTHTWNELTLGLNTDVDLVTTPPVDGDSLVYDDATGTWVPGAGLGPHSIDYHTDVDTTTVAPVVGDTLTWDGTNWVPQSGVAGYTFFDSGQVVPTTEWFNFLLFDTTPNGFNTSVKQQLECNLAIAVNGSGTYNHNFTLDVNMNRGDDSSSIRVTSLSTMQSSPTGHIVEAYIAEYPEDTTKACIGLRLATDTPDRVQVQVQARNEFFTSHAPSASAANWTAPTTFWAVWTNDEGVGGGGGVRVLDDLDDVTIT